MLMGGVRVSLPDRELTRFRTHKTGALLGCLALRLPARLSREQLTELFWPGLAEEAARNNLSTALSSLRSQLEPPGTKGQVLLADKQQVGLNPEAVVTDVMEFERFLEQARSTETEAARGHLLAQAIALYRDGLMPDCYEDWILPEQTRLRERCANALRDLATCYGICGEYEAALNAANRSISLDALDEEAYRLKMRLLMEQGRAAAAQETYAALQALLQRELGAEPGETTRKLAAALELGKALSFAPALVTRAVTCEPGIKNTRQKTVSVPQTQASDTETFFSQSAREGKSEQKEMWEAETLLPLQLTRFFGRREEMATLQVWLHPDNAPEAPDQAEERRATKSRLVTLTGPGGAGKTRLALEVAARLSEAYRGRLRFVTLADIPHTRLLSFALAHALHLPPSPAADPLQAALEWLQGGPALLVLDNFEHLLNDNELPGKTDPSTTASAAAWVRLLLERAPHLTCLVTSRRIMGLQGEQEFTLSSLSLPQNDADLNAMQNTASVALYVDRAQKAKPDFALTTANAAAIGELCRRLEGMPLALEMTAAWVKTITPHKMLERMAQQLDMLVSRQRDLPARHRSLRATCEWSYALLAEDLRQCFTRLSVFQDGCTLEAAEAVCGERALEQLARLQEHSLVLVVEEGESLRYRLLEPLRAFGAEKVKERGDEAEANALFCDYFFTLAETLGPELEGENAIAHLNTLDVEFRNLMAAFYRGLDNEGRAPRAWRAALNLRAFFRSRGHSQEGLLFARRALENPAAQRDVAAYSDLVSAVGTFCLNLCIYEAAYQYHLECLALRQSLGDDRRVAATLHNIGTTLEALGTANHDKSKWREAEIFFQQALDLNRALGNALWEAYNLNGLGTIARNLEDYERAMICYEQSLALRHTQKDVLGSAVVLSNMALVARLDKMWTLSHEYHCRTLALTMESGDKILLLRCLDSMAMLLNNQERFYPTVVLLEACRAARKRYGVERQEEELLHIDQAMHIIGQSLSAEEILLAQQQGHAISLDAAVNYAIANGKI